MYEVNIEKYIFRSPRRENMILMHKINLRISIIISDKKLLVTKNIFKIFTDHCISELF